MGGDNLACQEEIREEQIDGEIVTISRFSYYNHNRVAFRIACVFERYLQGRADTAVASGTNLFLGEKNRFIPDMMVVCDRDKIKWDGVHGAPDLVVEVLSVVSAMRDRTVKMQTYQKYGVREYWIVTPEEKSIEQYLLQDGAYSIHEVYSIYPDCELEEMTPEARATIQAPFKCSLFDDLKIDIRDIFNELLPIV